MIRRLMAHLGTQTGEFLVSAPGGATSSRIAVYDDGGEALVIRRQQTVILPGNGTADPTWCVIGEVPMILSETAFLCPQLRS